MIYTVGQKPARLKGTTQRVWRLNCPYVRTLPGPLSLPTPSITSLSTNREAQPFLSKAPFELSTGLFVHRIVSFQPGISADWRVDACSCVCLTDDQQALLGEVVGGDLEVEGGRSLSYPAGDVVVGAVAGAEPAAEVAGLADGDTTEMGADTYRMKVSQRSIQASNSL